MADIDALTPVIKPAVEAVTYDKFVVDNLVFVGNGITDKLVAQVWLTPGRKIPVENPTEVGADYVWELYPEGRRTFTIADVWELAATDADVANTITALATTIARLAAERGII